MGGTGGGADPSGSPWYGSGPCPGSGFTLFCRIWPCLAVVLPCFAVFGRVWPCFSGILSYLALFGPVLAVFSPIWPGFACIGHIWPGFACIGHIWPGLATTGPGLATRARFGYQGWA